MSAHSLRKRIVVTGRVQGVAFRAATRAEAQRLGVAGWVKNRADGSVEAALEGEPSAVAALVAFCRRGPRLAEVRELFVTDEPTEGLVEFAIR